MKDERINGLTVMMAGWSIVALSDLQLRRNNYDVEDLNRFRNSVAKVVSDFFKPNNDVYAVYDFEPKKRSADKKEKHSEYWKISVYNEEMYNRLCILICQEAYEILRHPLSFLVISTLDDGSVRFKRMTTYADDSNPVG